ncbi:MAG: hypothetical protein JW809_08450 [Pirellulales bacterium]|nr:hypothetical protein [Pirellulales bacterium]
MRHILSAGVALLLIPTVVGPSVAADGLRPVSMMHRYGIEVNLDRFPQSDPQTTIRSVIKATKAGQVEYMLAHLISPSQVDDKLHGDAEAMRKLAAKATPEKSAKMVAALSRQLTEGTWTIEEERAWSRVEGLPTLSLEKIGDHWYMHNTPVKRPSQG